MATSNTPVLIPKKSQDAIISLGRECMDFHMRHWNLREQFRKIDLSYIREENWTKDHRRARTANAYGDSTKFQDIEVPIVMPAVESAVTYQSSVFLTGEPLFGVVSDPAFITEAKQLEAIIGNQARYGKWTAELMKLFRDGFKYNLGAVEVPWCVETTPAFETDLNYSLVQGKPKEITWAGNKLKKLDLYNTFFDSRVAPTDIPLWGEFVGYIEIFSRIKLKQFIANLPDKMIDNVKTAFESGMQNNFYTPWLNPETVVDKNPKEGTNWMVWATGIAADPSIRYQNSYEVTTLYARILPSDFNLKVPSANTPQVWKFIIINNQVLLYAERQTNAHGLLPVLFIQPYEDGLTYQTKSLATNVKPIQSLSSAMWNSIIAARRRAISDRTLYDPSRITEAHINNPNPAAKIPVRPSAYGKDIRESVFQFPFRDDQTPVMMQETQQLAAIANVITGQNPVRQGQFVKGNKTQHEFQTVMGNANGRDQTVAMLLEAQFFTPFKQILKINILQYQPPGEVYDPYSQKSVQIDPSALRKATLDFKVSDGLIPSDKIISSDAWSTSMQVIGSSPQINQEYNIAPMFSYLMKTQGADLTPFEKSPQQITYEQAVQSWQQVVMQAVKAGSDQANMPPQPKPQDYGYNPGAPAASSSPGTSTPTSPGTSAPPTPLSSMMNSPPQLPQ